MEPLQVHTTSACKYARLLIRAIAIGNGKPAPVNRLTNDTAKPATLVLGDSYFRRVILYPK